MLADLVFILAAIALVGLVAGWEIFCLTDLARAERVRFLPRWAWAVACLIQIPLGGVLYLLIGRVWQRKTG
jgi:Phospholipase_D-nuclease N-terminal